MKALLHAMVHVPVEALQTAIPFDGGAGQTLQPAPQKLVLVSDWQMPEQLCVPVGHVPLHAIALGMHAPLQSLLVEGQDDPQARPSQDAVPPPLGAWQAVHDVLSFGPQVARALLSTHLPPQTWKPPLQPRPQVPETHAADPLGSVGHIAQAAPQPVGSLSGAQRVPQR